MNNSISNAFNYCNGEISQTYKLYLIVTLEKCSSHANAHQP